MKYNSVTMIKMLKETEEHKKIYEDIIFPEMGLIFDEDDDNFVAIEEIDGADVLFLFVEQSKVDKLIELVTKYELIDFHKEVSDEILQGDITDVELLNLMMCDEFKDMFDSFILKNLNSDMVLDKIIEKGIESLTENDKKVLENTK